MCNLSASYKQMDQVYLQIMQRRLLEHFYFFIDSIQNRIKLLNQFYYLTIMPENGHSLSISNF